MSVSRSLNGLSSSVRSLNGLNNLSNIKTDITNIKTDITNIKNKYDFDANVVQGDLLIGNSAGNYSSNRLTAGSNLNISNTDGDITVNLDTSLTGITSINSYVANVLTLNNNNQQYLIKDTNKNFNQFDILSIDSNNKITPITSSDILGDLTAGNNLNKSGNTINLDTSLTGITSINSYVANVLTLNNNNQQYLIKDTNKNFTQFDILSIDSNNKITNITSSDILGDLTAGTNLNKSGNTINLDSTISLTGTITASNFIRINNIAATSGGEFQIEGSQNSIDNNIFGKKFILDTFFSSSIEHLRLFCNGPSASKDLLQIENITATTHDINFKTAFLTNVNKINTFTIGDTVNNTNSQFLIKDTNNFSDGDYLFVSSNKVSNKSLADVKSQVQVSAGDNLNKVGDTINLDTDLIGVSTINTLSTLTYTVNNATNHFLLKSAVSGSWSSGDYIYVNGSNKLDNRTIANVRSDILTTSDTLTITATNEIKLDSNLITIGDASVSSLSGYILDITSGNGSNGDCKVVIRSDVDNTNESANPSLTFEQDGGVISHSIGINDSNNMFLNTSATKPIIFKITDTQKMSIENDKILIGDTKKITVNSSGAQIGDSSSAAVSGYICDITSGGGSNGNCLVVIRADTDNTNESANPALHFQQDGGITQAAIGINNSNKMYLDTSGSNPMIFIIGSTEKMSIDSNSIDIKDDLIATNCDFSLEGDATFTNCDLGVDGDVFIGSDLTLFGAFNNYSDGRIKYGKTDINDALSTIKKISPVSYRKTKTLEETDNSTLNIEWGIIAQEFYNNVPEMRYAVQFDKTLTRNFVNGDITGNCVNDIYSQDVSKDGSITEQPDIVALQYNNFHALNIKAIQELLARVEILEQKLLGKNF